MVQRHTELATADPRVGRLIGRRWSVLGRLRAGSTGVVYAAADQDGRTAALKVLSPAVASDPARLRRLRDHAPVHERLGHPGLPRLLDYDLDGLEDPFLAVESLQGQSLAERSRQSPPLGMQPALSIVAALADILGAAHRQDVWHGEVKPSHVFLCSDGTVKLLDFDLGPSTGSHPLGGLSAEAVATMSPEQAAGQLDQMGPPSDVFSLGAVLYWLISGRHVHQGSTAQETATLIRTTPAPPLASVAPDVPKGLSAIVDRALAFAREDRYPDALAFGHEIQAFRARSASVNTTAETSVMMQDTHLAAPESTASNAAIAPGRPPAGPPELVGTLLADRYQIDKHLGSGGMGSVYQARHVHIKKAVAIKVLHRELIHEPEVVARFEREAVAAARIDHPNVAAAHDFGRLPDGSFYLVLEYVHGRSLRTELEATKTFSVERAVGIARQICSALEAAHAAGVVHRDLKPENVMLTGADGEDVVKVLDFGIAKVSAEELGEPALTRVGSVFGTPEYMSPEQAAGQAVDVRTDLYAVGIMLYEMVAGRTPFSDDNLVAVLSAQLTREPPPLAESVAPNVQALIARLLAKAPEDRLASAEHLRIELDALREPRSDLRQADEPSSVGPRWRAALSRLGAALAAFGSSLGRWAAKPWVVRGRAIPRWLVPAAGLLGVLVVILATTALSAIAGSETGQNAGAPGLVERLLPDPLQAKLRRLRSRSERGDPSAVAELASIPPSELVSADWLALGRGHGLLGDLRQSLAAYERAAALDPRFADDLRIIEALHQALGHRQAAPAALAFVERHPSARGADLLYDTWSRHRTSRSGDVKDIARNAQALLGSPGLQAVASPALKVALDLGAARQCRDYRQLLPRAISHSDGRSLPLLRRLTQRSGCGFLRLSDCFGCLRNNWRLSEAIARASERPAPTFRAGDWDGGT